MKCQNGTKPVHAYYFFIFSVFKLIKTLPNVYQFRIHDVILKWYNCCLHQYKFMCAKQENFHFLIIYINDQEKHHIKYKNI